MFCRMAFHIQSWAVALPFIWLQFYYLHSSSLSSKMAGLKGCIHLEASSQWGEARLLFMELWLTMGGHCNVWPSRDQLIIGAVYLRC